MDVLYKRHIIVGMNKIMAIILLFGFLAVDFLFFHDFLKPGENISPAQYLTGLLSVVTFVLCVRILTVQNSPRD